MKLYIWLVSFTLCQLAIFVGLWYYYWHLSFKHNFAFSIAKTSAQLINLNLCFLLLSLLKLWKRFVYISVFISQSLHKYFTMSFIFWCGIHVTAHYINFIKKNNIINLFNTGTSITGHLMIIFIILLSTFTFAFTKMKSKNYSLYIGLHYSLAFCLIVLSLLHNDCISKSLIKCSKPTTWIWLFLPLIIMFYEINSKLFLNKLFINRVISHKENILELQLPLSREYCGKTIWINSLSINALEWHPFTVAKWNGYQNSCSIYIKIKGDWTNTLQSKLNEDPKSLKLKVDGPYHCVPKKFLNKICESPTLLVSTGIGITNFAYCLQLLSKNLSLIKSKITMIIIVKSPDEIDWLLKIFILLRNHIEFIFYFTEVPCSTNAFPFEYRLGRPQFDNILDYLVLQTIFIKWSQINIFYSGLPGVVKSITSANQNHRVFKYYP